MRNLLVRVAAAAAILCAPHAWSQGVVSIDIAPPPLLDYAQPVVPGEGYVWMPGYWSWNADDLNYYWVPGTWVLAPQAGYLWTPGYWAFENTGYFWHIGYWGRQVGFYGGINYGYGYFGSGYQGGRWDGGAFRYNRAVSNVNIQIIHNVYNAPVQDRQRDHGPSFNGGRLGVRVQPTERQRQFQAEEHGGPRPEQIAHEAAARAADTQRATGPHGRPNVAATPRAAEFTAPNVEHARPSSPAPQTERPGPRLNIQGQQRPVQAPPHPQQQPQQQQRPAQAQPQEPQRQQPRQEQPRPQPPQPQREQAHQQPQKEQAREPHEPQGRTEKQP